MSATLHLMGDCHSENKLEVLSAKADTVALAAQRLLDMRMERAVENDATVILSALDLDIGASKPLPKAMPSGIVQPATMAP